MLIKQKKDNASCIICGKGYHLCIACERTKNTWQPWKIVADTENCFKIYNVLNDYNFGKISKEEAKNLLAELDLSDLSTFKESAKKQIEEIKSVKAVEVKKIAVEKEEAKVEDNAEDFTKNSKKKKDKLVDGIFG